MKFKINPDLLPVKGQYFLFNAATAPLVPFLPTYAKQLGFSSVIVGTIYMVLPVAGMLAKPLFGAVADRFRLQKTLFLVFQMVTLATFFVIQFVPEIPTQSAVQLDCGAESIMRICSTVTADQCFARKLALEKRHLGDFHCKLNCSSTPGLLNEVCEYWKVPEYCGLTEPLEPSLSFHAVTRLLEANLYDDPCLYFQIQSANFSTGHSYHPYCKNILHTKCTATCDNPAVSQLVMPQMEDVDVSGYYQFWLFFVLMIASWVGMAVVVSIGDTICFGMLGDNPSRYGHQRFWGSVGWGLFVIITGVLVDEFSGGKPQKDYTVAFYLMLVMLILDMLVSSRIQYTQTQMSASIVRDVGQLFCDPRIVVYMLWTVSVGLCTAMVWQFLFWHIEDLATDYGCDVQRWVKTLEGLISGVQCFGGEMLFFFLSGYILRRIGHVHCMSLVLLAFGIRFILYSILVDPWWCLPIELFQGLTFGLFFSTMASYASVVSPPGTEATVQGLVGALFEGVGVSVGSLVGGILMSKYGGSTTFLVFGVGSLLMFLLHVMAQIFLSRSEKYKPSSAGSSARYAPPSDAIRLEEEDLSVPA